MERIPPSPVTLIAGAIAGAVPFVVSMASYSARWENGAVVESTYRDWIAVGGGGAAIVCGIAAIAVFARAKETPKLLAAIAIVALGGYQIARGLGVFFSPPAPPGMRAMDPSPPVTRHVPPPSSQDPASCPTQDECDNLAAALEKTDVKAARIANERSCNFGGGYACEEAAGRWFKDDPARARVFYDKACTLKKEAACTELGVMYFKGEGGAKDEAKGREYLEKACAANHGLGCKNLTVMYRDGAGAPVDLAKATAYAAKACAVTSWTQGDENALAWACNFAGTSYLNGEGVAADKKLAVAQYQKACELSAKYCFNLAASFHEGVVEKDLAKAKDLYKLACDAGQPDACNNLGDMQNRGEGGPKDLAQAKQLFGKACDAGLDLACTNLKKMK